MKHDILADMFTAIRNAESTGSHECMVPNSSLIMSTLKVMKNRQYIGGVEVAGGARDIKIKLLGRINRCSVVKPHFSVKKDEFIKFEKRYLPAQNIGILILTTPKGVMDQQEASKKGTGGRLLGYVY